MVASQEATQEQNTARSFAIIADRPESVLNMQHLEFLLQYCTDTYRTFASDTDDPLQEVWQIVVVRMAISFPPLMYELLAIAALHLAYLRPTNAAWYLRKSTELQTEALTSFAAQSNIDESNCGQVLIFASVLGLHMLCDPNRTQQVESSHYLDHVIETLGLLSKVKGLTITGWEQQLKQTDLRPLLEVKQPSKPYDIPQPCIDLALIAQNSDLSVEASQAYAQAIERLQWAFAVSQTPYQRHSTVQWLLAWPIQLSEKYLDLLSRRMPEALIIIAYYGAMMVFYADCWTVGDKGVVLIRAINAQVGPRWGRWMKWPCSFLTIDAA